MIKIKILLACPMRDQQSGIYIHSTLIKMGNKVAYFDWREITTQLGLAAMNEEFKGAVKNLDPDLVIVVKGLGITAQTLQEIKEFHKKPIVGWIFDVTLGGTYLKDSKQYIDVIKNYDRFYTIDNEAVEELRKLGVNAKWLPEGCFPPMHGEQVINNYQKKQFGADVVFIGSVGTIHPNRERILERLHKEGIDYKIYGEILYLDGTEPEFVKQHHSGYQCINDMHSVVCQSSKIVLGIDGWPERSRSWSARMYRVMCAGGFYLTTHTKDIEQYFKLGEHLDTFKNDDEMIEKILFYLQNDEKREKIAKEGKELVNEVWTFETALAILIGDNYSPYK